MMNHEYWYRELQYMIDRTFLVLHSQQYSSLLDSIRCETVDSLLQRDITHTGWQGQTSLCHGHCSADDMTQPWLHSVSTFCVSDWTSLIRSSLFLAAVFSSACYCGRLAVGRHDASDLLLLGRHVIMDAHWMLCIELTVSYWQLMTAWSCSFLK